MVVESSSPNCKNKVISVWIPSVEELTRVAESSVEDDYQFFQAENTVPYD